MLFFVFHIFRFVPAENRQVGLLIRIDFDRSPVFVALDYLFCHARMYSQCIRVKKESETHFEMFVGES